MAFRWLATCLIWLLSSAAFAAPYDLSYGGRLTESSGKPIVGPVNLRVTFFRSVAGNDQVTVAIPDFTGVVLQEGVFQISLTLSAADFHTVFSATDPVFIQIEDLSHSVIYPRQKFTAVPYALKVPVDGESITYNASGALSLGNGSNTLKLPNAAGSINKVLKSDGAGALVWADDLSGGGAGSITSTEIQDGTITNADIAGAAAISSSKISGLGSLAAKSAVGAGDITDGSVTGTDIANGTITDANINATANISYLKISGLGGAASKNVGTGASEVAAGDHSHSDATTSVSGFMSAADKTKLDGVATGAGVDTNAKTLCADGEFLRGEATTTCRTSAQIVSDGGGVTTSDTGTVTSTMIANGTITDSDINASAAIAGSKINPNFGSQNIVTTGTISGNMGLTSCPSGFTMVGAAGKRGTFCIDTNERTAASFFTAKSTCHNLSLTEGKASLCDHNKWYEACDKGLATGMTGADEWVAEINVAAANGSVTAGSSTCSSLSVVPWATATAYRCCLQ